MNNITPLSCRFCSIVNGQTEEEILFENEWVIVVRDPIPRAREHLLIIPKKHFDRVEKIETTDEVYAGKMLMAGLIVAKQLGIDQRSFHLIVNGGETLGHRIDHLHMHFMSGA